MDNAINYIHTSYNEVITLNRLASLTNLSEGQFCRLFKILTGVTPFSYLNRYRVIKSCEYLGNSTKKIAEIATLCGFSNISYYNREFIKYIKITPSTYRKMNID
jgi:AraC-like DNA-binding protein